jgi:hypothetical protein
MIDPMEDAHAAAEPGYYPRPRRVVLKVFLTVIGLVLAVFAYLWFAVQPRVPTSPIHWVRTGNGPLGPAQPDEGAAGVSFEAQMGKTESNNSFSSCAVASESSPAGFPCARLAVFNRSDHLLMARVGGRLLDQLKPLAYVRQLDYYPAGFHAEEGQLAPDLTITLDLEKLAEHPGLASSTIEATISVRAGNAAPDCHNSYVDSLTPPLVQLDWSGRLEHRSTTTGVASSAARYQQVADDIAKQIATSLIKEIDDRRKKYGPFPDLPADFYPAYRKPVALPLDTLGDAEQVWSRHGLMNHNETLWRINIDHPPADRIGQLQKRLHESGWEKGEMQADAASPFLRIGHKDIVLQVYPAAKAISKPNDEPSRQVVYVHYLDRMSQPEFEAAIDQALDRGASNDVLVLFERHWSAAQQQTVLKKLQASPTRTPQAALTLAKLYHRLGQDANSKRELLCAEVLLRAVDNPGDVESQLRTLAKELGDEKLVERPVDVPRLLELGFKELNPAMPVAPQEVGVEQPVLFFVKPGTPKEELRTIAVRVARPDSAESSAITLAYVEATGAGRSWGTGGSDYICRIGDTGSFCFKAQPLESKERFRITAQWMPDRR